MHRKAFTLVELLLTVAILSILATIVILAVDPEKQLFNVEDAVRKADIQEIQNAGIQYVIIGNAFTGTLPSTAATAVDICNDDYTGSNCTSAGGYDVYSQLVPTYITSIPVDPSVADDETINAAFSGYKIWKDGPYISVCSRYGSYTCD